MKKAGLDGASVVDADRLNILACAGLLTRRSGSAPAGRRLNREGPHQYDFYQLVRVIERVFADASPVGMGDGAGPRSEPIQFRQLLTLAAPSAHVPYLTPPVADRRATRLIAYVTIMGLASPAGVLPQYFTRLAMAEARQPKYRVASMPRPEQASLSDAVYAALTDAADFLPGPFGDFLDLFTHRLVSLHYRAWERSRPLIGYERNWWQRKLQGSGGAPRIEDQVSPAIAALLGLRWAGGAARLGLPEPAGGLPSVGAAALRRPRPAYVLQHVLEREFGVRVRVIPLQGPVLAPASEQRSRLGVSRTVLRTSRSPHSGDRLWLARKEWHPQDQITIELGPMTWPQYQRFFPARRDGGGSSCGSYERFIRLARLLAGEHVGINIRLKLASAGVPRLQVGRGADPGMRLGWSTWLSHRHTQSSSVLFVADPALPPFQAPTRRTAS